MTCYTGIRVQEDQKMWLIHRSILITVAGICAWGTVYADSNLLPNGDFSDANQISNWTLANPPIGSPFVWSSDDAGNSASSGSLELMATFFGNTAQSACFRVTAGAAYAFGGEARLVGGGPSLSFGCFAYAAIDCSGTPISPLGTLGASGSATWVSMIVPAPTDPPNGSLPPGSQSVQCRATNSAAGLGGTYHLDNLYFNSLLTTPVRLQSFDVE
jgi:hypothetical protein